MDYELAKQLKDAGFPIKTMEHDFWGQSGFPQCTNCGDSMTVPQFPSTCDKIPTLSELIEACGYGFRQLVRHTEYNNKREEMGLSKLGRVWSAKAGKWAGEFITNGYTPEEAVAKLWLKLNSKEEND